MTLDEYKARTGFQPLRLATLVFLVRRDQVMLARKKRGFGQGKWNGVGGKVHAVETPEAAAVRESREEIGVTPASLRHAAVLDFYFTGIPEGREWDQRVMVYVTDRWAGEPTESEEMTPQWFAVADLPFADMWPDDRHWLPPVLSGRRVFAEFLYGDGERILDYTIRDLVDTA